MSAYVINGAANPALTLIRGRSYTFKVNTPGHPFYIKTQRVTGTGSTFDQGVTNNGTTSTSTPLVFDVPMDAPSPLFYQCSIHSAMGATITLIGPTAVPALSGWLAPSMMCFALLGVGVVASRRRTRAD